MTKTAEFDLEDFTPYLLSMAAETTSLAFQHHYKARYGMLRTEWQVVFHLGQYGPMFAKDICTRGRLHKTKVSRAVAALEDKRFLMRQSARRDRRQEVLTLTKKGRAVFEDLFKTARDFDEALMSGFSEDERDALKRCLTKIARLPCSVLP